MAEILVAVGVVQRTGNLCDGDVCAGGFKERSRCGRGDVGCVGEQRGRVKWLLDCQAGWLTCSGSRLPQPAAHHALVGKLSRDVPKDADVESTAQRRPVLRLFVH